MTLPTKALINKTWLETRSRFFTATVLIGVLIIWTIVRAPAVIEAYRQFQHGREMSFAEYIWISLYRGYLQAIWIASVLILALGGLWREQAQGSAMFSLSLPATRRMISWIRICVASVEAVALGFLPALLIPLLSPVIAKHYPVTQALRFSLLMTGGGMVLFAFGILLSHVIQKEFTAPALGIAVVLLLFFVSKLPAFDALDLFDMMSGKEYLTQRTFMLLGSLPWAYLVTSVMASALIMATAVMIVEQRDF